MAAYVKPFATVKVVGQSEDQDDGVSIGQSPKIEIVGKPDLYAGTPKDVEQDFILDNGAEIKAAKVKGDLTIIVSPF